MPPNNLQQPDNNPSHPPDDPLPNPEPSVPSLDRPDPGVFHHEPVKPHQPAEESKLYDNVTPSQLPRNTFALEC